MKKLLYNRSRDTIFNLDTLVKIKLLEENKIILLEFPNQNRFSVFPGYNEYSLFVDGDPIDNDLKLVHNSISIGNYNINKKLYEYFEHKFTRASLCQKTNQDCSVQ